jgi:osmotically-inducible protein OsmY
MPPDFAREADKRLFLAVRRRLWDYEPLRTTRPALDMDVSGGIVRLRGRVRTDAMKLIAGYLVSRTEGVERLQNDLISDTEVVRSAADALAADATLGPLCLRVDARMGVVTIAGDIPAPELEARAIVVVRTAPRVAGVVSELAVRPAADFPRPRAVGGAAS